MAFLSRLGLLIRVSRPMFWMGPPTLYLLGILHSGVSPETIPATVLAIALSFPLCLCIFAVNDAYDYESDIQNPRKTRPWADGTSLDRADCQYALSAAKLSTILVSFAALPLSILESPQILGYIILGLAFSWTYSSPPIRFKERPIADSLSTGLLCWLAWACGFSTSDQATWASNHGWWVFLIGTGIHSLGAMVDAKPDAAAKHRTIATVYGERFAAFFGLICCLLATMLINPLSWMGALSSVTVVSSFILTLTPSTIPTISRYAIPTLHLIAGTWGVKSIYDIHKGQPLTW